MDFDVSRAGNGTGEAVRFPGDSPFEVIAGSGDGGAYLIVGPPADERPVVYVGSEGEGGLVATNLADALTLIVGVSSLHDATSYPWGDDAGRLREWLAEAEATWATPTDRWWIGDNRIKMWAARGLGRPTSLGEYG